MGEGIGFKSFWEFILNNETIKKHTTRKVSKTYEGIKDRLGITFNEYHERKKLEGHYQNTLINFQKALTMDEMYIPLQISPRYYQDEKRV